MNTLTRLLHRSTNRTRGTERGSVSVLLASGTLAMVIIIGLAVDLGGHVHSLQHARSVAGQAARAGGQHLVPGEAIRGQTPRADVHAAAAAAYQYLQAAGVPGEVSIPSQDTVMVTVTDVYDTKFLGIIGIEQMSVTGSGQSRMVRVREGVEQ